jgi:hypothetical protein
MQNRIEQQKDDERKGIRTPAGFPSERVNTCCALESRLSYLWESTLVFNQKENNFSWATRHNHSAIYGGVSIANVELSEITNPPWLFLSKNRLFKLILVKPCKPILSVPSRILCD